MDAQEANDLGLVDFLADNALTEAKSFANKLAVNSDFSMKFTKKMISDISNLNVNEAVDYCIRLNTISRSSEDFKKGIEDFLLKKNEVKNAGRS